MIDGEVREENPDTHDPAAQSDFNKQIELEITNNPKPIEDPASLGYLPESATFFYPKVNYKDALEKMPDRDGFFDLMGSLIPERVEPTTVLGIVDTINSRFSETTQIAVVEPLDENQPSTETIAIINGTPTTIFNNLRQSNDGLHNISALHAYEVEGDEKSPTGVKYHYALTPDYLPKKSTILMNAQTLQKDPGLALVVLAHEWGHGEESKNRVERKIEGKTEQVSPVTEVPASLFGIKLAQILYEKTRDPQYARHAARNVELYNQAIYGNTQGAESAHEVLKSMAQ